MGSTLQPSKGTHVVIAAIPYISHFTPLYTIAHHLVQRGYSVSFISTEPFRQRIEEIGATLVLIPGWEAYDDALSLDWKPKRQETLEAEGFELRDVNWVFFTELVPAGHAAIQQVLSDHADESVIVLNDPLFYGVTPSQLGAPGLKPKGVISIGIVPLNMHSVDTSPPWIGSVYDPSEEGRKRNAALNKADLDRLRPQRELYHRLLEQLGVGPSPHGAVDTVYALADIHVQLCPKGLEYPRSDEPTDLRYSGGLPRREAAKTVSEDLPSWWEDVLVNADKKRIIAVSQGTITFDFSALVLPTLEGLADRDDLLVVVALGKKGGALPEGTVVPANARVADWVPFDDLLPLSDVLITNGGYGAFQNAIARGVPLVVAPVEMADKRDIAARVSWSGVGVNLGLGTPTPQEIKNAVDEILTDTKYNENVLKFQDEMASYDHIGVISEAIEDLVRRN